MNLIKTFFIADIIVMIFLSSAVTGAELDQDKIKNNLTRILGANNQGTEFVLGFFPAPNEPGQQNNIGYPAIRLYMTSQKAARIVVEIAAKEWKREYFVEPNKVIEVVIPDTIAQMSHKTKNADITEPAHTYIGGAIKVVSDVPIICYGVLRYSNSSEGFLALPLHALGKDYILASYTGNSDGQDNPTRYLTPYTAIVGAFNKTRVTFTFSGNTGAWIPTSDGDTLKTGKSQTKILNKGDIWLIPARGLKPDLTGSHVRADKPVACFSGNFCASIPYENKSCSYIIEQNTPTYSWGTKYYVPPLLNRKKCSVLRLFASQDITKIYRNGWEDQVCIIQKKIGSENVGWIEVRADEGNAKAVTLLSKNRFNVAVYNPGQEDDNVITDPFSMELIPEERFNDHVVFCTPGVKDGLHYIENYLNIIYQATEAGEIPEDLEIGTIDPDSGIIWKPIMQAYNEDLGYEFIESAASNSGRKYYSKQIKLPEDGIYHLRSNTKLAAYLYGQSDYDTYGYPAAVNTIDLEKRDTVKPRISFTIDCDGNVPDMTHSCGGAAYVVDMPDEEGLRTNLASIFFDKDKSYNYQFLRNPLIPGEDRYVEWVLKPLNSDLDARGVLTFTDRAGNDTTIIIEHWVIKMDIIPGINDIGRIRIGETKNLKFVITNNSLGAYVSLSTLRLQKGDQGFKINYTFDPEIPIAPGDSRELTVTFSATRLGKFSDWIGVGDLCSFKFSCTMIASVEGSSILVEDAVFPQVLVNNVSSAKDVTIRNEGNIPLTISGVKEPKQSVFRTDLADIGIGPDTPYIIDVNKELRFRVWFEPVAESEYIDSIVFVSDADVGDPVCMMKGIGESDKYVSDNSYTEFMSTVLPNPLDSRGGQLEFENPVDGNVEIVLFNSLNQQVAVLQSGWLKAGKQSIRIPVETHPSGAYTFRIVAGKNAAVGNFVINK